MPMIPSATSITTTSSSSSSAATSRRGFFGTTAATATAAVATSLFGFPPCALAAESSSTTNYDIYVPPPGSLQGKVVLITGGTSGLGLESAKRLATAGATIIVTGRTRAKGDAAVAHVKQYLEQHQVANDKIYSVPLDLDSLQNVKSILSRLPIETPIDILINNAGVMAIPNRELTEDGYERTFQSNHLGHFVLTATLAPRLAKDARIINVSSMAYLITASPLGTVDLDAKDLNFNTHEYGPWKSYGASKLENIFFTQELQRRVDDTKGRLQWTVLALHPGGVQTNLARYLGVPVVEDAPEAPKPKVSFLQEAALRVTALFIKTVEQGASTQVYLAAAPSNELQRGAFYSDCRETPLVPAAQNPVLAKELWDASERLGGVSFPLQS